MASSYSFSCGHVFCVAWHTFHLFFRSEAGFICTSHSPKSSCKESTVSQSVYSSPSMSRLTYVSESDSTLKNTSVTCDPETHWVRKSKTLKI